MAYVLIYSNGSKAYLTEDDDFYHREDGPAYISIDGEKRWYKHDVLSNLIIPSIINPDGMMEWYHEDLLQREGGPALDFPNGAKAWFMYGHSVWPKLS